MTSIDTSIRGESMKEIVKWMCFIATFGLIVVAVGAIIDEPPDRLSPAWLREIWYLIAGYAWGVFVWAKS